MVRRIARLLAFSLLLGACGGGPDSTSTTTTVTTTTATPPSTAATTTTTATASRFSDEEVRAARFTFRAIAAVADAADFVAWLAEEVATDSPELMPLFLEEAVNLAGVADSAVFLYDPEPALFSDVHADAVAVAADIVMLADSWESDEIDIAEAASRARQLADRATAVADAARAILVEDVGVDQQEAAEIAESALDELFDDLFVDLDAGVIDISDVVEISNVTFFVLEVFGTREFELNGVLTNTGDVPLDFIELTIDLLDPDGSVIESSTGFASTLVLEPGGPVPFSAILWEDERVVDGTVEVADVVFVITGREYDGFPPRSQAFDIVVEETEVTAIDVTVRGTVTYRGDEPVGSPIVVIAAFDPNGGVIGVGGGGVGQVTDLGIEYNIPIVLEPGDSAPFLASTFLGPGTVARTTIVVEGTDPSF